MFDVSTVTKSCKSGAMDGLHGVLDFIKARFDLIEATTAVCFSHMAVHLNVQIYFLMSG